MPANPYGVVLRRLRGLVAPEADSDAALLSRFVRGRDEAAFTALVQRHGPAVLGLCRRWLGQEQDAEDVFQATFLVLARKAHTIRRTQSPGSFLFGVALRLARKARAEAARRPPHISEEPAVSPNPLETLTACELLQALDEELAALPEQYRAPLLLCHLQGRTQDEAARELAWSKATVRRRLARGRDLLKARLVGRGLSLPSFLGGSLLAASLTSPASAALLETTARAALKDGAGSAAVTALAEAGCRALVPARPRVLLLTLLLASAVAVTAGVAAYQAGKPLDMVADKGEFSGHQEPPRGIPAADQAAARLRPDLELVAADADVVASVQFAKLWTGAAFESYRAMIAAKDGAADAFARTFGYLPEKVDRFTVFNRGKDFVLLVTTAGPTDRPTVRAAYAPGAAERRVAGKPCYRNEEEWTGVAFLTDSTAAFGAVDALEAFLRSGPKKEGPQGAAIRLAAEHDLVVSMQGAGESGLRAAAGSLPASIRKALPFFQAESALLVADAKAGRPERGGPPELRLDATVRYETEAAAREAAAAASVLQKAALGAIEPLFVEWNRDGPDFVGQLNRGVLSALTGVRKALADLKTERKGRELTASMALSPGDVGTLAVSQFFFNTYASGSDALDPKEPHLEDLAKAILAYHADRGRLPPHALYAADGKTPLLSWRVLVLPYLGDEAKRLYAEFKLDEPWDGEHNIRLVRRMAAVFAPRSGWKKAVPTSSKDPPAADNEEEEETEPVQSTTPFQVLVGPGTLFDGPRGRPLSDATDGAANTVLIAQAFHQVPWTKPQDLVYAPDKPLPRLGSNRAWVAGVALAFGDGEVQTLPAPGYARLTELGRPEWVAAQNFDEAPLRALITRAGGEKVDRSALRTSELPTVAPRGLWELKVFEPER
jgi:RNA polymerase sigma factor (sigma-70 family)